MMQSLGPPMLPWGAIEVIPFSLVRSRDLNIAMLLMESCLQKFCTFDNQESLCKSGVRTGCQ